MTSSRRIIFGMPVRELLLIGVVIAGLFTPGQEPVPAAAPPNTTKLISDAQSLYRKGSFDLAVAKYNEVLKADPHAGDAYAGIIRCYLKQDKVREADEELQKGLQASPGHADFKVAEAELLFRQGEIPEAGALFNEVIATPPSPAEPDVGPNARAYLGAARVAAASANHARERVLLMRAHAIDGGDPDIRKKWMQTLSASEQIKSLEDYLGQPNNDDAEIQRNLRDRVEFLKAAQSAQLGRCHLSSEVTGTQTTLRPLQSRGVSSESLGVAVSINGQDSVLLLDTGASGIVISSKLATKAGLKPVADIRMTGIGDKPDVQAHLGYADSVRIGDLEFRNCPVHVVDRLTSVDDGIIGTDVFAQFLIEMDFPTSTLRLSPLPPRPGETPSRAYLKSAEEEVAGDASGSTAASEPRAPASGGAAASAKYFDRYVAPEMHSYVQVFRFGHMLLVPTKINDGTEKLFLLDSGSFDNTISPEVAEKFTKVHRAPRLDVRGLNGEVKKVYVAEQVMLDFGHLRQTVPDMVAIDMSRVSRNTGTEVSGTLGMVMLHLLTVRLDYRDALADFRYTGKPPRR